TNFLLAFDTRFTNRKKLPPSAWLAAFYSLCLFSITKTLLIDTPTPHQSSPNDAAARLATAHKILVSLFAWSAILSAWCPENPLKLRDPLLTDWTHESNPAVPLPIRAALTETRRLVNRDGRAKSYTLHTKNFLLGLGAGNVEGGGEGFATQRRTDGGVASESGVTVMASIPLPSIAARAADKRPRRRELSKEQRKV
ncbi:hypothetical protein V496_07301, partial [Pseudogymnoascus sp. VKM F-4515 (FW-2607)]